MNHTDLLYTVALSLTKHVGPRLAKKLIAAFGSAESVFKEGPRLASRLKIHSRIISQIRTGDAIKKSEEELNYISKHGITALVYNEDGYPPRLNNCVDAPLVVFIKGNGNLNPEKAISIVGTRSATSYGKDKCREIVRDLSALNVQIVSGLALGVDTVAHRSALDSSLETVAALGHGFNRIYPFENRKLSAEIQEHGLLITDFATSDEFLPGNFPSRNRIIAGISDATLVIESNIKGGSMITAEMAQSYNKDVFALPGRADAEFSSGCNHLIKMNKAALVENAEDIISMMQWTKPASPRAVQQKLFVDLSEPEQIIVDIIRQKGTVRIDEISRFAGTTINRSAELLLELEFKNLVRSLPGKNYMLSQ